MDMRRRRFLMAGGGAVMCALVGGAGGSAQAQNTFAPAPWFRNARRAGPPAAAAVSLVNKMSDSVGIRKEITLYAAEITSKNILAFANVIGGRRYIVYDRNKLLWPNGNATWWNATVLGHEVGHHIANHIFQTEYSDLEQELEADRFAGFALSRLGASHVQATAFFSWDWPGTSLHPSAAIRRAATSEGWRLGESMKIREGGVSSFPAGRNVQACETRLLGKNLDIGGKSCRIVRTCSGRNQGIRLACQDNDGSWRWAQGGLTQ